MPMFSIGSDYKKEPVGMRYWIWCISEDFDCCIDVIRVREELKF